MQDPFTYTVIVEDDGQLYAVFSRGEKIGPYLSLRELEREMELLKRHLKSKAFAGAAK